jgi:hypothetical protein
VALAVEDRRLDEDLAATRHDPEREGVGSELAAVHHCPYRRRGKARPARHLDELRAGGAGPGEEEDGHEDPGRGEQRSTEGDRPLP